MANNPNPKPENNPETNKPELAPTFEFSIPENKSRSNGTTGKLYQTLLSGKGLTASEARSILYEKPELDHDKKKTRKALRAAQAQARLNGLKTATGRAGLDKTYFICKPEHLNALKEQIQAKGLTFEEVISQ